MDRQQVGRRHPLHERRLVAVVDEDDAVDLLGLVQLRELVADRLRVVVGRLVGEARPLGGDLVAAEAQRRSALAPDGEPRHFLPLGPYLPLELEGPPQHLAVERPGEAAVAGDDDEGDPPDLVPLLQERKVPQRGRRARRADHQLLHPVGVRPHLLDAALRTPQPGAGDQLERLRDLARVADGRDPPPEILERGH